VHEDELSGKERIEAKAARRETTIEFVGNETERTAELWPACFPSTGQALSFQDCQKVHVSESTQATKSAFRQSHCSASILLRRG
jgi:hypothetical protein